MSDLSGKPAEVHFTISIKRAATGLTEHYQMVGRVDNAPQEQPQPAPLKEQQHDSGTLDSLP